MLDLKALDPERHVVLTGPGTIDRVLERPLGSAAIGLLNEVRLMLVPGSTTRTTT